VGSAREVPVYSWTDHSVTTIPIQRDIVPLRVLWDAKRDAVYRLRGDPDGTEHSSRIDGVYLSSGTPLQPIALPAYPIDFTFSVTGDSLVVTFVSQRTLGVVDLLSSARSTTTVPLQYTGEVNEYGEVIRLPRVAHAAGGRFFVALVHGLYGARLLEVNLSTGEQVIRIDIAGGVDVAANPSLFRLPDGRLLISPDKEADYDGRHFIYSPTTDAFAATFGLRAATPAQYSASSSGRFMMRNTVFDAALDSVAAVTTQDWMYDFWSQTAAALSPDGRSVYLATRYGYEKVRLSDGFIIEQVKLKEMPIYLFAVADGSKLIAVGESSVMVVDLR
jgi:hypothetical protein